MYAHSHRVLFLLSAAFFVSILLFANLVQAKPSNGDFGSVLEQQLKLTPFDPKCGNDGLCKVWQGFRSVHPFPYQTFAVAPLHGGSVTLIISEPPPVPGISKTKLEQLVRTAFGTDFMEYTTRRWMVGVDGWLEDVVVQIKPSSPQYAANPENDPVIQDRVRVLQAILFGTRLGAVLERADADYKAIAHASAADIASNPAELRSWVSSQSGGWMPLDPYQPDGATKLDALLNSGPAGAYIGDDQQLVVFVLPAKVLDEARIDADKMEALRRPFRLFAVSSDEVLGGVWNQEGGLALIGRSRRAQQESIPPLRFETFAALALENTKELQQSYERTNLFAGKLLSGPQLLRDWAPILLSDSLIDSEFGALLNITDQLLKSWSEGGYIDYLYFDYPLSPPKDGFVFGTEPLSHIVERELGGKSVLFNWNTAGAAVIASDQNLSFLSAGHTSALPVTYGSDINGGDMQTGDSRLIEKEKVAYDYFVARQDPNLARVVSYNLIYQTLRFAHPDHAVVNPAQKTDGNTVLVERTKALLAGIENQSIKPLAGMNDPEFAGKVKNAKAKIIGYYKDYGKNRDQLAQLLADPRNIQAYVSEKDLLQFTDRAKSFEDKKDKLKSRYDAFDATASSTKDEAENWVRNNQDKLTAVQSESDLLAALPASLRSKMEWLKTERAAIEHEGASLKSESDGLQGEETKFENTGKAVQQAMALRKSVLDPIIDETQNLESIRAAFVATHNYEPKGWIKTPSIVVSWNAGHQVVLENLLSVGGHNLTVRAVRFETDPNATAISLEQLSDGTTVVRIPSSQESNVLANAPEIARKIEHEQTIKDKDGILQYLRGMVQKSIRKLSEALGLPWFNRSSLAYGNIVPNSPLRSMLMSPLEQNPAFVAATMRDQKGYFQSAYRKGGKVECCMIFGDTANMQEFMVEEHKKGAVLVMGESDPYVENLAASIQENDPISLVAAAGGGGRILPPKDGHGIGFAEPEEFNIYEGGNEEFEGEPLHANTGDTHGQKQHGSDDGGTTTNSNSTETKNLNNIKIVRFGKKFEALTQERDFSKASKINLEGNHAKVELARLNVIWDDGRDGTPYITSLEWTDGLQSVQMHIIVGLEPNTAKQSLGAINKFVASTNTTSMEALHTQIKAYKDKYGIKRILSILEFGKLKFRIAHNDSFGVNLTFQ